MASQLPAPVAAALGIVPTVLDGIRSLPSKAFTIPIKVIGGTLSTLGKAQRTYANLADRGERAVGHFRGEAEDLYDDVADRADDLEDRLEAMLAATPLTVVHDTVEEKLEDAVEVVKSALPTSSLAAELAHELTVVPEAEQPKGEPTPPAPTGSVERIDTAATPEVVAVVEEVALTSAAPVVTAHDDLPLPDYDHMTLGSLRGRLRSLSIDDLVAVRAYEKAHADRLPVVTMLDNRLARLATDATAEPSAGGPAPVKHKATSKPKVTKATAAEPSGPATGASPGLPLN